MAELRIIEFVTGIVVISCNLGDVILKLVERIEVAGDVACGLLLEVGHLKKGDHISITFSFQFRTDGNLV